MKKKRFITVMILIVAIVAMMGIIFTLKPEGEKRVYEIVEEESLDYRVISNTSESSWVVTEVKQIPTEQQLIATAFAVWKEKKTVNIFLYLPDMNVTGTAYSVVRFEGRNVKEFKIITSALKGTKWEIKEVE